MTMFRSNHNVTAFLGTAQEKANCSQDFLLTGERFNNIWKAVTVV
jgi:hypothetical protein